jgi:hypothetical protein
MGRKKILDKCPVPWCEKRASCGGYCKTHYERARKGTAFVKSVHELTAQEKLEERCMPIPWTGCWIWLGSVGSHGYGDFRMNNKGILAHRAAWELANGCPVPGGRFVLHHCDNKLCVNPAHLFVGTNTDNMRDKLRKGRHVPGWCEEKLTQEQIDQIRALRAAGVPQREVAARFHRHPDHIRKIANHKVW